VFLPEIDPQFAAEQYRLFRDQYTHTLLDFVFVREYPRGVNGRMDVDSGILVGGLSPVASGVMMASARMHDDEEVFTRVLQLSEVLGVPVTWGGAKHYLLGALPVGEEWLAWGKTVIPWRPQAAEISASEYPRLTSRYDLWLCGIAFIWLALIVRGFVREMKRDQEDR
jgi:hypothetical protein